MGSLIIYAISDSDDRNNLSVIPEKYEIINTNNSNCSGFDFYGYKMCFPWNEIKEQFPNGEEVAWVRFKNGPMIIAFDPSYEVSLRLSYLDLCTKEAYADLQKKHADELRSIMKTTLTNSNYEFIEKTLYSTFEDYKFFTPFKQVYSDMILLMNKIHICRLRTGVYSEKILAFRTKNIKGFQINFESYKEAKFYDLYIFKDNSEFIKIKIIGNEGLVKQADLDSIIYSINKN
jgi:hypothetical protein